MALPSSSHSWEFPAPFPTVVTQLVPLGLGLWHEHRTSFSPINSVQKLLALVAAFSNPTLPFGGALEAPEGVEEELVGSELQEQAQAMLEGVMTTPRRGQALPGSGSGCIRALALQEPLVFTQMLCCWL